MVQLKNVTTRQVSIGAPYDRVFNYLTNPLHYKEWSTKFILDVLPEGDHYYATTPVGKIKFSIKADSVTGNIDLFFGDASSPISTRLLRNGKGVTYLFTLFQPEGMPDMVWTDQGIPNLIEELETLKANFK